MKDEVKETSSSGQDGDIARDFPYTGLISAVDGLAAEIGLQPGDELLAINDQPVRDVIDVQFYAAEQDLDLLVRREGDLWLFEIEREPGQSLGLAFEHSTFDTDIMRCNNRCLFCFVIQMAPPRFGICPGHSDGFRKSLYVKDDDYRYSFLDGNYVTLTNLQDRDWQRIAEQRLSPLYVSVHATDNGLRRRILGNRQAPNVMEQLQRLSSYGIEVHTQLVIVPGINDGFHLDRSIQDLASLWPAVRSVSVVPVGLTRFHRGELRTNTPAEANRVLDQVDDWQDQLLDRFGERFVYATDEWFLLTDRPTPPLGHYQHLESLQENGIGLISQYLSEWPRFLRKLANESRDGEREEKPQKVTLVTGTLFAPVLGRLVDELAERTGTVFEVRPVVNGTLGETITVAGLLLGSDVIRALQSEQLGEKIVLPSVMFRGPGGVSLDGLTPSAIGESVGCPNTLIAERPFDLLDLFR